MTLCGEPRLKETAMENYPDGKVYYTVKRSGSGQWEVNELGSEKPIVSFSDRTEAVDFAQRLTEAKTAADVPVQRSARRA